MKIPATPKRKTKDCLHRAEVGVSAKVRSDQNRGVQLQCVVDGGEEIGQARSTVQKKKGRKVNQPNIAILSFRSECSL